MRQWRLFSVRIRLLWRKLFPLLFISRPEPSSFRRAHTAWLNCCTFERQSCLQTQNKNHIFIVVRKTSQPWSFSETRIFCSDFHFIFKTEQNSYLRGKSVAWKWHSRLVNSGELNFLFCTPSVNFFALSLSSVWYLFNRAARDKQECERIIQPTLTTNWIKSRYLHQALRLIYFNSIPSFFPPLWFFPLAVVFIFSDFHLTRCCCCS